MTSDPLLMPFDQRVAEVKREARMDQRRLEAFDRAASLVDRARVAELQTYLERNLERLSRTPAYKYFDFPLYLADKAQFLVELDLDRSDPCRMLDLGAGAGHFMFLARCHGHRVSGIDMENEVYSRMLHVYGLERRIQTILAGAALDLAGPFDLVTSIQTTFNRPVGKAKLGRNSTFWSPREWGGFFSELCGALTYPGRIFFHLNPQPDPETGCDHRPELLALFARNGARIDEGAATALFELERPLVLRG